MLNEMSPRELDEWMAFSQIEPFGEPWVQTASICCLIANTMGSKKGGGTFKIDDFLPKVPQDRKLTEKQSQQAILKAFQKFAKRRDLKPPPLHGLGSEVVPTFSVVHPDDEPSSLVELTPID